MIKYTICFLISLFSVQACQTQEQEESNKPTQICNIPWLGYANAWREIERQYEEPQKHIQRKEMLTQMVQHFFKPSNFPTDNQESRIFVNPSDLKYIGNFFYKMSFFYDALYPSHPWGHFKITSPMDSKLNWRSVWFRVYGRGNVDCFVNVTFFPTEESA